MTEQNQINNIDRMLKKIWDNFSLHPTEIYLSESGLKKVTEKVLGRKMSMIEFRRWDVFGIKTTDSPTHHVP